MKPSITEYRREAIRLLSYIGKRLDDMNDSNYYIMGSTPAYPDSYVKREWDSGCPKMEEVVERIKDDLKTEIKNQPEHRFQYELFIQLLESIEWEEI